MAIAAIKSFEVPVQELYQSLELIDVNAVIQDKLGDPSCHVGENWVDVWLGRWGNSKHFGHSKSPEPTIVKDYFRRVRETISKHRADPDCLLSIDETSIASGHAHNTRVIGHAGNCVQLSQGHGTYCRWCMHVTLCLCYLQMSAQLNLVNIREQPTHLHACMS